MTSNYKQISLLTFANLPFFPSKQEKPYVCALFRSFPFFSLLSLLKKLTT
jgi:hypothetical protein